MTLKRIDGSFSVCRLADASAINWADASAINWADDCVFLCKTGEELSLVCRTAYAPPRTLAREDGWAMLRVAGELDFSLVGVLASLTGALAQRQIPVFAVSTYCTDTLLVKTELLQAAVAVLRRQGHEII